MSVQARIETSRRPALDPEEILDRSAELFAERGYRATSLEHVARSLKVTRQALYYHFPRKQDILVALFERMMSRLEAEAAAVAAAHRPASFRDLLSGHARAVAANIPLVTILLAETAEIPEPQQREIVERRRAYNEQLVAVYRHDMQAGLVRRVDSPRVSVNVLIGSLNLMTRWYAAEGELGPEAMSEQVVELLERGFAARSGVGPQGDRPAR